MPNQNNAIAQHVDRNTDSGSEFDDLSALTIATPNASLKTICQRVRPYLNLWTVEGAVIGSAGPALGTLIALGIIFASITGPIGTAVGVAVGAALVGLGMAMGWRGIRNGTEAALLAAAEQRREHVEPQPALSPSSDILIPYSSRSSATSEIICDLDMPSQLDYQSESDSDQYERPRLYPLPGYLDYHSSPRP